MLFISHQGSAGLVLALTLGKRRGYDQGVYHVHNTPFVFLGAALLWFGWYGFNAGSALAANGLAAHAFMTTSVSAAAALVSWMLIEVFSEGKNNFSRSFHRISYRTGSNHTGSRICSNVGSSDLWIISKPNLLLRCKTDQRKIKD